MPGGSSYTNDPIEDDEAHVVNRHANMSPKELMEGCTISIDFTRIEPKWWGVNVTSGSNMEHMTTYMGEQLKAYQLVDLWDEELLGAFQEQFEGWTEDMFKKVHPYGVCQVYITPEVHFPVLITPNSSGVFNTRGFPV